MKLFHIAVPKGLKGTLFEYLFNSFVFYGSNDNHYLE